MNNRERIPSDDWSLDELGQFCVAQDRRMALDAWMTGKAIYLAKERCNKEKESFTSWKSQHGFSHAKVSRYMRLYAAFAGEEDLKRLSELGIMDALREAGIAAAKEKNAEMDGNEQSAGDGAESDSEPSGARPNARVLAHAGTPPVAAKALSASSGNETVNAVHQESSSASWAVEDDSGDDELPLDAVEYLAEMWSRSQTLEEECRKAVPWQVHILRQKAENLLSQDHDSLRRAWPEGEDERRQISEDIDALLHSLPELASTVPEVVVKAIAG
jgi:hypothetical protein